MKFTTNLLATVILLFTAYTVNAQDTIQFMSYNLLHYYSSPADSVTRNPFYRTIVKAVHPDIMATCEVVDANSSANFLAQVLKGVDTNYARAPFITGFDTNTSLFFNSKKFKCTKNEVVHTTLRDINHYYLITQTALDTLHIFVVHLKASSGVTNEAQRKTEVDSIRKVTNQMANDAAYIVCGDFNFYNDAEPAYIALKDTSLHHGYFIDPITMTGTWNNSAYAQYHTQSPRVRSFGGGVTGGMDDRFDMILYSPGIKTGASGIQYVNNSVKAFGNDGNHYNDSINQQPNTAVSAQVADALHYAADHIPVLSKFYFQHPLVPEVNGITTSRLNSFSCYPNPAKDKLTLQLHLNGTCTIRVFTLLNECVLHTSLNASGTTISLPIQSLVAGTYFIQVQNGSAYYTTHFVKQ